MHIAFSDPLAGRTVRLVRHGAVNILSARATSGYDISVIEGGQYLLENFGLVDGPGVSGSPTV